MQPGPAQTGKENGLLHLWCAYPDDVLDEAMAEAYAALLSEDERTRLSAFHFARHRREFLTTRVLARTALSHYRPLSPAGWCFRIGAHGKPEIDPDCGLRFSLSNSEALVACLIADAAEVGADIEPVLRAEEIVELAPSVFSRSELEELEALQAAERGDRALSLWTLKEAYVKARGKGMSIPLGSFSFRFGGEDGIRLEMDRSLDDDPRRWRFCLLDHAGHRLALMVESSNCAELEFWEAHPLQAPPRRLSNPGTGWFGATGAIA